MRSSCAAVLVLLALIPNWIRGQESSAEIQWWTVNPLVKVRPLDPRPVPASRKVELWSARNEFEPFQIVLRADSHPVARVDAEPSDLVGPGKSLIPKERIAVYFEHFLNVKTPSSIEGATGDWPDALIPRVDGYSGERRNAFPFKLSEGRNQALWVEIYVPAGTSPGQYAGSVRIQAKDCPEIQVPVTLNVWNFDLPSTATLKTAFGFSGPAALREHAGRYTSDEELEELTFLYSKAALLHRLSIYGGTMIPPPFHKKKDRIVIDWKHYDDEMGPFLDGTVLTGKDPLPGARATSVDLRTQGTLTTPAEQGLYWKEWVRHFREKGWLDRLYRFVMDEPARESFPKVIEMGKVSRLAGPEVKNLVTVSINPELADTVDIWVPLINCFDAKPGFPDFCDQMITREALEAARKAGKNVWWYQSCASHGCGKTPGGEYFRGWPSYAIDSPGPAQRIMSWLTFKYRMEGELYYSTNEDYGRKQDPWKDAYAHGGNGDGSLFYPGRPDVIGGKTDIPIESIRLKLIREGLEDFEYLQLLAKKSRSEADEHVASIVANPFTWKSSPETLLSTRRSIGEILDRKTEPDRKTDLNNNPNNRSEAPSKKTW
jgi:hypothetical protein